MTNNLMLFKIIIIVHYIALATAVQSAISYTFVPCGLHVHNYTMYHIVQNFREIKILQLCHHASIHEKTFAYASKRCPQVSKHFENSW